MNTATLPRPYRVGEAIEQALAAAPGDATGSSMTPRLVGALARPDRDLTSAPAWWLERHARVEHAEIDHRADAARVCPSSASIAAGDRAVSGSMTIS